MELTLDAATRRTLRREVDRQRRIKCGLIVAPAERKSEVEVAVLAVLGREEGSWLTAVEIADATAFSTRRVGAALRALHAQQVVEVRYRTKGMPSTWRLSAFANT